MDVVTALTLLGAFLLLVGVTLTIQYATGAAHAVKEPRTHLFETEDGEKDNPFHHETDDDPHCSSCGEQNEEEYTYCQTCGNRLL